MTFKCINSDRKTVDAVKQADGSYACPAGYYRAPESVGGTTSTGGSGDSGGSASSSGRGDKYDADTPVWNRRVPGTEPTYTPGTGIDYLNNFQTKTIARGTYINLDVDDTQLLLNIAKANGGRSGRPVYETFVDQSAELAANGIRMTPMELARKYAIENGLSDTGADGSGGSGGSGRAAPQPIDSTYARRIMDSVSQDLLGRTMDDKEFRQYYKSYTNRFAGNPDVDAQQLATESAKSQDDYQEFQIATKFVDGLKAAIGTGGMA